MKKITVLSLAMSLAFSGATMAKIDAEQAKKLSAELTPMGAIRAGNADGSIPEWTGGIKSAPQGYTPGMHHLDPYPNDKVQYTITAQNVAEYEKLLTPGQVALFKTIP